MAPALDDAGLDRKRALLARAVARGGRPTDPLAALAEYGGFEIAMMAGAMLGAAEAKMVLLIDGFIVTSALLVAHAIAPEILDYCVFAHRSHEAGHVVQLAHLGAEPLVQLDLRLGRRHRRGAGVSAGAGGGEFPQRDGQLRIRRRGQQSLIPARMRTQLELFFIAIGFFTRLPVPGWVGFAPEKLGHAARYLPLVGWLVGLAGVAVYLLAVQVLPVDIAVVLAMAATIRITGAFHEDGWADACDGLGGGWSREQGAGRS